MRISDWSSDVCSSDLANSDLLVKDDLHIPRMVVDCNDSSLQAKWHANCCKAQHSIAQQRSNAILEREWNLDRQVAVLAEQQRSEERRVGKEGVSTVKSRWSA